MNDIFLGSCPVLENRRMARETWLLRLKAPQALTTARPGQFAMLRVGTEPGFGPLLRRPFSFHRIGPEAEIAFLYGVVGQGTRMLTLFQPGDPIEILGPLGRGFSIPPNLTRAYLVGGGLGLAPLLALAESLNPETETTLFYGARSAEDITPDNHLELFRSPLVCTTDDGTFGQCGLVTEPLAETLGRNPAPIFACGPRPMLAQVAALARQFSVPAQVSLEARMACGLGVCLSCVVETPEQANQYLRVCQDGPVFNAEDVTW